ncbi:hypothetical protein ACIP6T_14225 [Pantoea sp. NPDC088449]|uniref:hypothetical protein n=2 Tax=unclassified Pantoea TaxID=2630326 RepID=UPI0037F4C027
MEMDDLLIKKRLINAGFTKKEINFIAYWAEKEQLTIIEIIKDLRARFIGGIFIRLLVTTFCAWCFFKGDYNMVVIGIPLIFSFIMAEVFFPLNLGSKAFSKYKYIKQ